jgi:wobble nucleotide-excising tRNase
MPIAQEMKSLADKIVGDYDARISVLGNIVSDTHDTLKGFTRDRTKMGVEQRKDLSSFVGDLVSNVKRMLKELQKEHKEMAEALEEALRTGETNRLKDFKAMLSGIQKKIKEINTEVSRYLAEVRGDMTAAAEAWQKMAGQMDKARHGVAVKIEKGKPIEAGIEISTAEEAAKPKKKGKRGRPRKS